MGRFPVIRSVLAFCCIAQLFAGCDSPVEWQGTDTPPRASDDSLVTYYRTRHFVFFYDSSAFEKGEVIANGKVKEAHLSRINSELKVDFDGEIMVRLIHSTAGPWSGQAFPEKPYFLQETRSYFAIDPGHEVVHVVSFETLGFPKYRFFVEGLAVAHELDDEPKWARLCGHSELLESDLEDLQRIGTTTTSDAVNYPLAGAYVEWLEATFGIERFKAFYRDLSEFPYSSYESLCLRDFGLEASEMHQRFLVQRVKTADGSKYCANH